MTVGEKIKKLRVASKITQEELAKIVGTSKQNIYKYETGIVINIPSDKIEAIAEALNTTPAYLMGYDTSMGKLCDGSGYIGSELKQMIMNISNEINVDFDSLVDIYLNKEFPCEISYNSLLYFFAHYLGLPLYVSGDNSLSCKQKLFINEIKSLCEEDLDMVSEYIEKIKELRSLESISNIAKKHSQPTLDK